MLLILVTALTSWATLTGSIQSHITLFSLLVIKAKQELHICVGIISLVLWKLSYISIPLQCPSIFFFFPSLFWGFFITTKNVNLVNLGTMILFYLNSIKQYIHRMRTRDDLSETKHIDGAISVLFESHVHFWKRKFSCVKWKSHFILKMRWRFDV